ncbi:MAG: ATP-binding protein [Planctomycetota bacterium]|nr:ATP-binding protein [Planctomycetota bacterium]
MNPQQIQQIEHCVFRETHDPFFVINPGDLRIIEVNPAAQKLSKLRRQQLLELKLPALFESEHARALGVLIQACQTTTCTVGSDGYWVKSSAGRIPAHITVSRIHTDPDPLALLTVRDMTERRRIEAERRQFESQLQHAQKLECLGVMAGGIAHDFNNLLTCILGFTLLADQQVSQESPVKNLLGEVVTATRRGAELTQQMLAYAGKNLFTLDAVNVSELAREMVQLLTVSISRKCEMRLQLANPIPLLHADPTQIRQVVMNLVTNAAEAIGDRAGVISVSTGTEFYTDDADGVSVVTDTLPAGEYVFFEVKDTGSGMSPETRSKIFDPFFSTRFTGRGLGMAVVLGIVRGHHGAIQIRSVEGQGTTVRVRLPKPAKPPVAAAKTVVTTESWHGTGPILVVDDEDGIRRLATRILQSLGFTVKTAVNGREAIEIFRNEPDPVRLVMLDWKMPVLDGAETLRELRMVAPTIRAIISSGYADQIDESLFTSDSLTDFLRKPFRVEELQTLVRKHLR